MHLHSARLASLALNALVLLGTRPSLAVAAAAAAPAPAPPAAAAAPANAAAFRQFSCGAGAPSEDILATIRELNGERGEGIMRGSSRPAREGEREGERENGDETVTAAAAPASGDEFEADATRLDIETYFHVVSSEETNNTVTDEMLAEQLTVLNSAFNPHRISFRLADTAYTVNDAWASGADEYGMVRSLRRGPYAALNLYFQTAVSGDTLGKCSLPGRVRRGSSAFYTDGCQLSAATLPGGGLFGYNRGGTTVHEAGHWMGLLHTFEGYSCSGRGDYIADTPAQRYPTQGCPERGEKDTCPAAPGVDPVNNFMDYSFDECYESFTKGQEERMHRLWGIYRAGK